LRRRFQVEVRFRDDLVAIFPADLIVEQTRADRVEGINKMARGFESQTLNSLRATNNGGEALLTNFGTMAKLKRFEMDDNLKRSVSRSARSVSIGEEPLAEAEVAS
jgi:hypothetical protein